MLIMSYDTESKSRNADFILIARRAIPQPSARRAVKPKNPWAEGPSILRTFPFTTLGAKLRQPSPLNPLNPMNPRAKGASKKRVQKNSASRKKGALFFLPAFMTISPASGQRSLFPFLLRPVLRTRRRRGSRTRCAIRRRWHRRCRRRQ